ncbi:transmembrane protein 14C-like [Argonauta hians]
MPVDYIGAAYSATLMLGGIMGYVKSGSAISMAAGVGTGTLAAYGAFQMSNDPKNVGLSLSVSSFMTALMGYRFAMSRKIMPAGVIAAVSMLVSLRNGMNLCLKN